MPYIAFSDFQLAIMLCLPHLWVTFPEGEKKKLVSGKVLLMVQKSCTNWDV